MVNFSILYRMIKSFKNLLLPLIITEDALTPSGVFLAYKTPALENTLFILLLKFKYYKIIYLI